MSDFPLSITQLRMLQRCGQQYVYRYLEGIKAPPGVALLVGRAVDDSVNFNLRSKIATGFLHAPELVEEVASASLRREWDAAGDVALDPEERSVGTSRTRDAAVDTSVALAGLHAREAAPALSPSRVQHRFELDLGAVAEKPVRFSGVIDVVETSGTVRDTKTAKRAPSADAAALDDQLTAYALAVHAETGAQAVPVFLDVLTKTKVPKYVQSGAVRIPEDYQPLLQRIVAARRSIDAGVFLPARPEDWWCSQKFCGYWDRCPFARRPVTTSVAVRSVEPTTPATEEPRGEDE